MAWNASIQGVWRHKKEAEHFTVKFFKVFQALYRFKCCYDARHSINWIFTGRFSLHWGLFQGSSPGSGMGAEHPTDQRQQNTHYLNTLTAPHPPLQLTECVCRHHSLGMSGSLWKHRFSSLPPHIGGFQSILKTFFHHAHRVQKQGR